MTKQEQRSAKKIEVKRKRDEPKYPIDAPTRKKQRTSSSNLAGPSGSFCVSRTTGEGDWFFDSIARGLTQLEYESDVKILRKVCGEFAQDNQQVKAKVIKDAKNPCNGTVSLPDSSISDDELWNIYLDRIKYTADDMLEMKINRADLYTSLTDLKYGSTLQAPIRGRSNIEGQVICQKYNVKLHITENLKTGLVKEEWVHKIVNETGFKWFHYVEEDCDKSNIIYIVDKGGGFFELANEGKTSQAKKQSIKQYASHQLIRLMYRLDLSVLCLLRKSIYKNKYPFLTLAFGYSEIDKFNNIILHYKQKSIHVQIEDIDRHYIDNDISHAKLFTNCKGKQSFSINNYFNSFVKHLISKFDGSLNNIEYLIIYTNSSLDLTEENLFKKRQSKDVCPKFDIIDMDECNILKDFLFTNDNTQGRGFYQFSQNKTRKEKLLKQLQFSSVMQKEVKERNLSQEKIKEEFLDKLVFAVNQPNREELNSIIKNEIEKVQYNYITLQEKILHGLTTPDNDEKFGELVNYIPGIMYKLNLLMFFLHYMFSHKNIVSINSERKNDDLSNDITIHFKDKIAHIKVHDTKSNIGYNQLFPSRQQEEKNKFSINKCFTLFLEYLEKDTSYFIIYTDKNLNLTEKNELKEEQSKDFYPLKFDNIDTRKKQFKILKHCSCINQNGLYKFAKEETAKLLTLLKLPPSLEKGKEEWRFSDKNEKEIKEKFVDKVLFAVNQPNREKLSSIIKSGIDNSDVPYNYEELLEIALRWSESQFSPITTKIIKKLFKDMNNNRRSYQRIKNIEEIKFAKSVAGREGTHRFDQFLDFLIKGNGRKYLEVLKREGVNLTNMSSILSRAGAKAPKAFEDLYNLWFDKQGKKTQYLKTLEKEAINLANMSSILSRAGAEAVQVFKDLYDLWFDAEGNKRQYLKTLEENGINLANMSSILSGAGPNAAKAFKALYDLWFDEQGRKTHCLNFLDENGINLSNMSNILSKAGAKAPKAFQDLYNLWCDEQGRKTQYLKTIEKEGIKLTSISGILGGAGANAAESFRNLYYLWFDEEIHYLKNLEKEGIKLTNVSGILGRAGANSAKAFKDLYDLWFDKQGKKTLLLKTLENEGIKLTNISNVLGGAGANAAKAFKDLYNLLFDKEAQYIKTLEKEGISLANVSSILSGAGSNAAKAFKDLYDLWFDKQGKKTHYLKALDKEGINLANMSSILNGAGCNAAKSFKDLFNLWFDRQGKKTQYLKTLEEHGVNLSNMSSILSGAGPNAAKAFKDLYNPWFNEETQYLKILGKEGISLANMSSILSGAGSNAAKAFKDLYNLWFGEEAKCLKTLEKQEIKLTNISSVLHGAGSNAAKAFKNLYNLWFDEQGNKKQLLKHFIEKKDEKSFTIHNLSSILSGAGANIKVAFEKLHDVCFNAKGKRTRLLNDFYRAGFWPGNLSCMLCGAGVHASSVLKRFHGVCFNEKSEKTKILVDFYSAGIKQSDLCNMLSGSADDLEEFYEFCFIKETKTYLYHFIREGFIPRNLPNILHGARTNICSALRDFHDVCFDEKGNKTQFLDDFLNVGFTLSDLSCVLFMAGNNAAHMLRSFHKLCFNKENYLNHFLAEDEHFTPKSLSKILDGVGIKICSTFEKLHDLCFDKTGNKTNYLNNLIEVDPPNKILDKLYKKVRKYPSVLS